MHIDTSIYEDRFKVLAVYFNELDQHFNKIVLEAIKSGRVEKHIFGDNIVLKVRKQGFPIFNEIKKRGVVFDRNKEKELL